jgi:subtilisin family serine protease
MFMALRRSSGARRLGAAVIAAGLVAGFVVVSPAASAAPGDDSYHPAVPGPAKTGYAAVKDGGKFAGGLDRKRAGTYRVFVQFAGSGAAAASKSVAPKGKVAMKTAVTSRRSAIKNTAAAVLGTAAAADAKANTANRSNKAKSTPIYTTTNSVPGVAISASLDALKAISGRNDVVKITPLVPKKFDNAGAAQFTKVLNTWQSLGLLGTGVKVGVIDTGIDYTHADFGGVGTPAAYQAAHAAQAGPFTPTAKVVGGYDFSGDKYNADPSAADYDPVPKPDPNPIDCEGHGSHVAGTVAGYGVDANGSTFAGDYRKLTGTALYDMKIGPGMAPQASLYALKVFGCTGSTDVVGQALDWALDPNGDGDFGDHLDIVNLSLGSDFGTEDDPENAMIDVLAENGVLPVIAAGNAGDVTDAGGSPGNALRSLAVASVLDPYQLRDGIRVNTPPELAGIYAGQNSVAYDYTGKPPVTGDVAAIPGANADGCDTFSSTDAAKVRGKVAWLEWDDNDATRRCGSVKRSGNAQAAGAIGAIFTSQLDAFNAGITGSAVIPVFQIGAKETAKLRPAVNAGTLNVTFDGSLAGSIKDNSPALGDTISSFTSRGTHNAIGPVKPDVAAPGSTIASAGIGTGSDPAVLSGTSMATPHTAGISALVKQAHPDWTTEQIKADIMNTAGHDVYSQNGQTGLRYGPARVGSGRVDALAAATNQVLAYNTARPGGVSTSFGVVWVPASLATMVRTQTIKVQNTGTTGSNLKVSYESLVTTPGVKYTVSPSTMTLLPRQTATVTVTMTITTSMLDHTIDPTMTSTTPNPLTGMDEPRQFVTDASGRVLLAQTGKAALRVPVYGVVKPVSTTTTTKGVSGGKPALLLNGKGVSGGITSLVSVLQLGGTSPKLPACSASVTEGCTRNISDRSGDIKEVGVGSVKGSKGYSNGFLWFGIATYQNWVTIGHSMIPYVDIDTNADGTPDYEVYVASVADNDLIEAFLIDFNSGELLSVTPVNFNYGDVETNVFDSNAILLPVDPAAIGITPTTTKFQINYTAGMYSAFTGSDVDTAKGAVFDVAAPRVQVGAPLYVDEDKAAIPYTTAGNMHASALVVHLHGTPNIRTEVVQVK